MSARRRATSYPSPSVEGARAAPAIAVRDGVESRLMLQGRDLVAYFAQAQAVQGRPELRSSHAGVADFLSSAASLSLFEQEPRKYQSAYQGYDATRIVFAIPDGGDSRVCRVIDGRPFIVADEASKAAFELETPANIALADPYWTSEVEGSNGTWQRAKRGLDRLPHYKNSDDLASEVAAAKAKAG
jgi:hypothetical protein